MCHSGSIDSGHYYSLVRLREHGDKRVEAIVLQSMGGAEQDLGHLSAALQHQSDALAILQHLGNTRLEGIVLGNLGGVLQELGRLQEARLRYEESLEKLTQVADRRVEGIVRARLVALHAELGQPEAAAAESETAGSLLAEYGHGLDLDALRVNRGWLALLDGDPASARAALASAQADELSSDTRMAGRILQRGLDTRDE